MSYILEKYFYHLSIVYRKCGHEYKKIIKEEESTKILKILRLMTNIEVC